MIERKPKRIQLRRSKGWRKPAGCVVVARPATWGNPYVVKHDAPHADVWDVWIGETLVVGPCMSKRIATVHAVRLFRDSLNASAREAIRRDLRGHDLACWCALDAPCHADVLLKIANA